MNVNYLVLKWFHIVAIISWMAGLLYLFRLFVYHSERGQKSRDNHDLLSLMEKRLLYFITHPAMGVSWLAGIGMIVMNPVLMKGGWMHTKLLCVVGLTFMTIFAGRIHKRLVAGNSTYSSKGLRILNEVPTLLMIIIVGLVILKPF
jgi:putative membrane protein